ncbi:YPDG domain-containing protein, partial [Corynebacterium sp. HMSC074C01]|uniref:YPDG domain-containing protein n=1 Tax=Corynebacterium sp. HMSC074C01 TaxID=1739482 RepID=UPI000B249EB2
MDLKSFNGSARRRGTTIAAAALSVAMVAPFVHPVVSPNAAPAAIAQDATPDQKPSVDTRGTSEATAIRADGTWGQKQGYQGTVYLDRDSGPEAQNEADEAMSGVKVFLQYVNGKGQVSPIYYTTSDSEGKFVFDLSNAPKDGLGNPIEFKLAGDSKFQVRTWAENPDPAKYTLAGGGDMYSGRFHNRLTRKWESWDFTAGINRIVGAKVVFQERPNVDGWLAKPETEWTEAPTVDKKWPEGGIFGTARGSVWWENNENGGTLAQRYFKDSSDRAATDVKVVGSYVNDEVARQFDAWKDSNKNYTREQFRVAQKEIVDKYQAEHGVGSHIAESRVAYVKDDGTFYLPFAGLYGATHDKKGKQTTDEEWGKLVSAEEEEHGNLMQWNGTAGQRHRHINEDYMYLYPVVGENRDLWMGNYQDNMFQPSNEWFLGQANTSANISVQNFALLTPRPIHDVINYDNASAIAAPGDTAKSKTTGLVPNQEYAIEWFADGESTGEFCTVTANELGELESCDFTVPNDLSKPTVYSSQVFAADASGKPTGTLLLADSFLADPTVVNYDETKGTAKEKDLEVKPSFDNPNTDTEEKVPEGTTFEFVDPAAAEKLGLEIDDKTGVITWPADKQVEGQNEALVKVTWTPAEGADPVSREVPAKFDLDAPAAKDNETFEPGYEDGSGKPGEDVTVPAPEFKDKDGNPTDAPDGTTFKPGDNPLDGVTVNEDGSIKVAVPEDAKPGDKITVPVVVTYPDGSTDEVSVEITVTEEDVTPPSNPDASVVTDKV